MQGIHRWPVNSPHNGQWRRALMFPLICAWINNSVNNRGAGDLRCHRTHYDIILMLAQHALYNSLGLWTHKTHKAHEWVLWVPVICHNSIVMAMLGLNYFTDDTKLIFSLFNHTMYIYNRNYFTNTTQYYNFMAFPVASCSINSWLNVSRHQKIHKHCQDFLRSTHQSVWPVLW